MLQMQAFGRERGTVLAAPTARGGFIGLSYEALSQLEDVKVPLEAGVLSQLRVATTQHTEEGDEDEDCAVCLQPLSEAVIHLGCSHRFHEACALQWFQMSSRCPLCMTQVTAPPLRESPPEARAEKLPTMPRGEEPAASENDFQGEEGGAPVALAGEESYEHRMARLKAEFAAERAMSRGDADEQEAMQVMAKLQGEVLQA